MVNEWTRNDLPDASVATDKYGAIGSMYFPAVDDYRDAVVAHLNANGGVPASREDAALADRFERQAATIGELQGCFLRVEADAARWRRAHSIVEQERDQARERLREVDSALAKCMSDFQDMEDESDEWKARAEAAEARTAPAVTKADIEKAIRGKVWAANREPNKAGFHRVHIDWATDAVWSLVSGADQVEELAGQIEAATRTAIRQVCDDLAAVAPSLDPLTVERAMEVTAASRKVAAHVLGQEAKR